VPDDTASLGVWFRWLWVLSWHWDGVIDPHSLSIPISFEGHTNRGDVGLALLTRTIADALGHLTFAPPHTKKLDSTPTLLQRLQLPLGSGAVPVRAPAGCDAGVGEADVGAVAEREVWAPSCLSMLLSIGLRAGRAAFTEAMQRLNTLALNPCVPVHLRDVYVASLCFALMSTEPVWSRLTPPFCCNTHASACRVCVCVLLRV